jgi:hypothetical protein
MLGEAPFWQRMAPPDAAFPPVIVNPVNTAPLVAAPLKVKALPVPLQSMVHFSEPFSDLMVLALSMSRLTFPSPV